MRPEVSLRRLFATLSGAVLLAVGAPAQSMGVYGDQLQNGWQNWSWCATDFNDASYAYMGAKSVKVTYTGGWQGFYLHSNPVPATFFKSFNFFVHGGTVAGRNVSVSAIVNGSPRPGVNLNAYVKGGVVVAGKWKAVTIPLSALGVAAGETLEGFWLQEAGGGAQPAFWLDQITLEPNPVPTTIKVKIKANGTVRTVDPRMFGVNTAVWNENFSSATCKSRIAEMGLTTLRFPGGSLSDGYHWKTNTSGSNTWQWTTSFDTFASVAQGQGAQAFITVNYGTGNAGEAANWVAYSNVTKKYGFKYWEVGNENYGTWEEDSHARKNDPYTYAQQFAKYYTAMKAKDPTIKVGAVASVGEDSFVNFTDHPATNPRTGTAHHGWTPVMLDNLKRLGCTPDFIVYHRYPTNEWAECDFTLLQSYATWPTEIGDLRQQLSDYLGAAGSCVEIVCTENNATPAQHPGKQMTSLVNALFMADSFGAVLQTECNAYLWWDLINGQDYGGNNGDWLYGWRNYGDFGLMSPSPSFERYAPFYAEKLVSKFAAPGDKVLPVTSTFGLLSAYATKRADGSVRVMLINKSPSAVMTPELTFAGFTPQSRAESFIYGIDEDRSAQTGTGSPDLRLLGVIGAGAKTTVTVAPYSAVVFVFQPATSP